MKTTVGVETFEQMRARSLARARKLARGEKIPAERRITFEDPELMLACLTPQRIRLFHTAKDQPLSITELAATLHRDRKSVHRDVTALSNVGVLKLTKRTNPGHGQVQVVQATAKHIQMTATL